MVWSLIGIDFIGLPKEIEGFKYIVTAIDYTSISVEAEPLKEKTSEAVIRFLYKLIFRYGSCNFHITDQSMELINSITDEYYC